ncbi:threonine synthase [Natranaerofaba carboxydovora]|uniref:threonine synthase n=1 Tax=Natranaerofaba carboxydovora TaxID=2742683 RepID=UPI001F12F749|nr:threonine synthase [Natranaerofaba carboxydovora]UMZ74885.1 Threonine synthase [Natranaerofaba carboxydovora]
MYYKGIIDRYNKYLPVDDAEMAVTLYEGNTALLPAKRLQADLGIDMEIYLKVEGDNPTGSFKDRGMTMALTKAVEEGSKAVICASTGNTSASASAYAARAGLKSVVLVPEGKIAQGKLSQALFYGAKVLSVEGNFDRCLELVREMTEKHPISLVNSVNPYRLEGQKTGAFEICDSLETSPDYFFIPVGNAGNISAYWMGFNDYKDDGVTHDLPVMIGCQAEGAAPLATGKTVENPETIATAIRIGNPASKDKALEAVSSSGGHFEIVTDDEIIKAYKKVGKLEGIFLEPASAASVAGLLKAIENNKIEDGKGKKLVCILTGHGLKDPETAINYADAPIRISPDINEIEKAVLGGDLFD